jgi:pyruvate dehydrogenase (quinone)/pyruvate oxidase
LHASTFFRLSLRSNQSFAVCAAEILNAGKRIAILAGRGALDAGDVLEQTAEILGAPIIKALLGRAAVPDDSPYTTGTIGLLGTMPSQEAMEECDTLFMVGTSFPSIEFLPKPGQARAVQIELDPMRIGLRYAVEVGLVADSRKALEALIPHLKQNENRRFLEDAQKGMADWRKLMDERAGRMDKPMKPQVVASELGKRLVTTVQHVVVWRCRPLQFGYIIACICRLRWHRTQAFIPESD